MQSAAPTAVPAPIAAAAAPARWWPKRTLGVVLPLVVFLVAASMLFVDPPTAPGRHPFSWFAGSGAPSLRGIPATHRPSAPLTPKPPPDTSREESSFLDLRQHEEHKERQTAKAKQPNSQTAKQPKQQNGEEKHSKATPQNHQNDGGPSEEDKHAKQKQQEVPGGGGVCANGKKVQRLYIGLDIGGSGTRAIPLLQCDGAPDALLAVPEKYSKKSDDMVVHVCKKSAAEQATDPTETNKCAGLARDLILGPLMSVTNDMASSFPDPEDGVSVAVFGYATAGARTLPSATKTLESLAAFKADVEAVPVKKVKGTKVNNFTVKDIRVLHGWEEARLELMLVSRGAADADADATAAGAGGATSATTADWEETNMMSFGSTSAQMAIRIDGDESKQPSSALLERWVKDYDATKPAKIKTVADLVKTITRTQFGQPEQQGDDSFVACGASERHFGDYLHILEHDSAAAPAPQQGHAAASSALLQVQSGARPGAHLLVSFLSSTNENCAPQHFGDLTAEVGGDHQIGELRDGPPCRARDLASFEDSRHKGYSHLGGGLSGVMHTFELWARKCLQSETGESKKTDDLKKLLCSCGFGGKKVRKQLVKSDSDPCEGMDILAEEKQKHAERARQSDRAKIFLQCQAAMETYFWWDDQAVFVAELLAEVGPSTEQFFHAAGALPLLALGLPLKYGGEDVKKCGEDINRNLKSGDITSLLEDECLLATYWRGGKGAFRPKDSYGGDGGEVVIRALLRVLGFGDGQPGAACGPRGEDTQDIMQESSVSGGTSEKGSTGGTASVTDAKGPEPAGSSPNNTAADHADAEHPDGGSAANNDEHDVDGSLPLRLSAVELSTAGGVVSSFLEPRQHRATFAADDTGNAAAASEKTDISFHTVLNGGGDGKTKLLVSGQSCLAVRDPREKHDKMSWVPSLTVGLLDQLEEQGKKIIQQLKEEAKLEPSDTASAKKEGNSDPHDNKEPPEQQPKTTTTTSPPTTASPVTTKALDDGSLCC